MMSAENDGSNGTNGNGERRANGGDRRKRQSALMKVAQALPSVESSLDDFISRANATLVDTGGWGLGEDLARPEAEAARQSAEEIRIRNSEVRIRAEESSIREQLQSKLDLLNGK